MPSPPEQDSTLYIVIGGYRFGGWLNVRVSRGIERSAGDFTIACTQRWPGQDARFEIAEGSKCEIMIGSDRIMTGYVDVVSVGREGDQATCQISGRSKTADLIDCSPDFTSPELAGLRLPEIAKRLAAPFSIDVVSEDAGPAFPVASLNLGETCWAVIERLARQRRLLVMDDEHGRLVLARLGGDRADDSLVHPSDGLKKIVVTRDASKRHSVYVVKGQAGERWAGMGTANSSPDALPATLAHVQGNYYDNGVKRYRPKTLLNEGSVNVQGAISRAEWEARRRIGRALRMHATRVGWRQSTGTLWRPNLLVQVGIPMANIDALVAISEVHFIKSGDAGTVTELEMAPPAAFTPEPPPVPESGSGSTGRYAGMGTTDGPAAGPAGR